jgi:hypothetical protein
LKGKCRVDNRQPSPLASESASVDHFTSLNDCHSLIKPLFIHVYFNKKRAVMHRFFYQPGNGLVPKYRAGARIIKRINNNRTAITAAQPF